MVFGRRGNSWADVLQSDYDTATTGLHQVDDGEKDASSNGVGCPVRALKDLHWPSQGEVHLLPLRQLKLCGA
jgi:hypothetical protein